MDLSDALPLKTPDDNSKSKHLNDSCLTKCIKTNEQINFTCDLESMTLNFKIKSKASKLISAGKNCTQYHQV